MIISLLLVAALSQGVISFLPPLRPTGGTIKFCSDVNFLGNCQSIDFSNNQCVDFESAFNDVISSVDTRVVGHTCVLFRDFGCTGPSISILAPHNNLISLGFNDEASSFRCSS
ncbi:hypothetical protein BD779DRAFT_1671756 [Infundibulicybe gibba]|nr:hypothetical protein BD779DRAFT_1671756 [Infundibulicybe gibba]